jgi:hypothetical protein
MHRKRLFSTCLVLSALAALLLIAPVTPLYAAPARSDEVVFGDDLTLREGEHIDGDLVMLGGNLTMRAGSRVEGSVTVFGGRVVIDGTVEGEVIALGGDVSLNPHAHVKGKVMALGGNVRQAESARVDEVVEGPAIGADNLNWPSFSIKASSSSWSIVWNAIMTLVSALGMTLLAVAVFTFWPAQTRQVGETIITRPLPSLGVGCLLYPLAGSLIFFLLITLCLSPFAPVVALLLVAASLFGWIALGALWGRWLMRWLALWSGWRGASPLLTVCVGVFTLTIGVAIVGALPCLGPLLVSCMAGISLGAVTLSRLGTSRYRPRKT